jgi:hypothetical protein
MEALLLKAVVEQQLELNKVGKLKRIEHFTPWKAAAAVSHVFLFYILSLLLLLLQVSKCVLWIKLAKRLGYAATRKSTYISPLSPWLV